MRAKIAMLLTIVALMLGGLFTVASPAAAAAPEAPVTVCHKPGTPAEHEITVNGNALDAHLAHGDTMGVCGPPPQPCNQITQSGGQGTTTTVHELGTSGPTSFQLTYEMYGIPDQLQVFYEGAVIYDTGGLVSGGNTVTVNVPAGTSTTVTVVVSAPNSGTAWDYTVFCPTA